MEITSREILVNSTATLSLTARTILNTLLYFDVFQYPLSKSELIEYSQNYNINEVEMELELRYLQSINFLESDSEYYTFHGNFAYIERRKKGNAEAKRKMKVALRMSKFISLFPFVEAVCISGSLSKNYMDKSSDIDFFIITTPHRLWLCRGLLVLFKKLFLLNSRKHFCINYYLDSEHLEIPDRNIFTATEIVFLKPTFNAELFKKFASINSWCEQFYPNKNEANPTLGPVKRNRLKRFMEWVLSGNLGEFLDAYFFKLTLERWKKKFPHFNEEEFDLNLRSRKGVSKHHPRGYQKIVMDSFTAKQLAFERQFNVKLS
jgi:hypothetical protein